MSTVAMERLLLHNKKYLLSIEKLLAADCLAGEREN